MGIIYVNKAKNQSSLQTNKPQLEHKNFDTQETHFTLNLKKHAIKKHMMSLSNLDKERYSPPSDYKGLEDDYQSTGIGKKRGFSFKDE